MEQGTDYYKKLLEDAGKALAEEKELTDKESELSKSIADMEKQIAAERELLRKTVDSTLKKRKSELEASYDSEIAKADRRLKSAKNRREKAKSQGMRERIQDETAELREENDTLKDKFADVLGENHVPLICRTNLYYALYFPRNFSDFLTLLICFVLCFAVVPIGIYLLLPERRTLWLILIYLADILVFGLIYILGGSAKTHHMKALKEAAGYRGIIRANRKKIRVITSSIRREGRDDVYDLEMYDDEIAKLAQELSDINAKKRDAVSTFDSVTSTILTDEISEPRRARIKELTDACAESRIALEDTQNRLKEKKIEIADQYETFIGRDFLTEEKLVALRDIMDEGAVENISEAKEIYLSRPTKKPGSLRKESEE